MGALLRDGPDERLGENERPPPLGADERLGALRDGGDIERLGDELRLGGEYERLGEELRLGGE